MKYSESEIYSAAKLILDCGISMSVPGWYHIDTPEEAVLFALDEDEFYKRIENGNILHELKELKAEAESKNTKLESYLHYLKYSDPDRYLRTGAKDASILHGGQCTAQTAKGKRCKKFLRFEGSFEKFIPGKSDRCKIH